MTEDEMADDKTIEVPIYDIPEDAGPNVRPYFEGLFMLNALFRAYGHIDTAANQAMMPTEEVVDALTMALALQISNDDRIKTPRDARMASEAVEKRMKQLLKNFMENDQLKPVVNAPGLHSLRPN